jgi:GntR family transcriptional regulator/MocR family aminotransferase
LGVEILANDAHRTLPILNRSGVAPALHRQIYSTLREAVLEGRLAPGGRIPSSRTLAATLGVSRPTVVTALDQLAAEGFIETRLGSGTYVAKGLVQGGVDSARVSALGQDALSLRARQVIGLPPLTAAREPGPRAFHTGFPALGQFPMREWTEAAATAWRSLSAADLDYLDPMGYRPLREAIAEHLAIVRGVKADPEQVMIVAGSQQALGLVAQAVADPGDEAWVEDPGYPGARRAFVAAGLAVRAIPVDAEGIDLDHAQRFHPKARLVHVTPSHQYPLGVRMSVARRLALVAWAEKRGAWILEDDYDSEFRYAGRPLAPLYAMVDSGRVIHVGTFSKVLFAGIRLGYMVVPRGLVDAFRTLRGFHDRGSPVLSQAALAVFMGEGRYQRHIRRMRSLYAQRRDELLRILAAEAGSLLRVSPPDAGLHLVAHLPPGVSDIEVARVALGLGVHTMPISRMAELSLREGALALGFAGVTSEEMTAGARALRVALAQVAGEGRP